MPLSRIQSESMNLGDNFAFTGTVTGAGGGKVLQFLNFPFSTEVSTTSTSFVSLGSPPIQGTITPTSASSKILIRFSCSTYMGNSTQSSYVTLYRGTVASGTHLGDGTEGMSRIYESNSAVVTEHTFEFVDSPNTTNATTYQVGFKSSTTSNPKRFVMNDTPCEMIIMEIAQ